MDTDKKPVWHCNRCGYDWQPKAMRGPYLVPKSCPACKRYDWQRPAPVRPTGE